MVVVIVQSLFCGMCHQTLLCVSCVLTPCLVILCVTQAFPEYGIEELRNGTEVGVDLLLDIMEGKY